MISGVVVLFLMTGCNYHQSKVSASLADDQGSQGIVPEQLSFKLVTEKVLQAKCLNCHADATGNRGGLNLETYANFIAALEDVRAEVEGKTMPRRPGPPLTDAEFKLLMDWIDGGANEFAKEIAVTPAPTPEPAPIDPPVVVQPPVTEPPVTEPPVVVEPPPVTEPQPPVVVPPAPVKIVFEEVFKKVIEPKCLRCHGAENPRAGVSLDTYVNVVLNKEDVAATIIDGSMPRRDTLSDEQKKLILTWIEQGAIEK